LLDSPTRTDRLVVHFVAALLLEGICPFRINRIRERVAPAPVIFSAANADVDVAITPAATIVLMNFIEVSFFKRNALIES
jgi:hypothetical protein